MEIIKSEIKKKWINLSSVVNNINFFLLKKNVIII